MVPPSELPSSDVLFTNAKTVIPGAPDHHVMFPSVWHTLEDTTGVVMAASHDNAVWNFVPGGSTADTTHFGKWDDGCIFARPNLIELADGSFAPPYTAYSFRPHIPARSAQASDRLRGLAEGADRDPGVGRSR